MTLETKAKFAKRMGVNRSSVTRWNDSGRLFMKGNLVEVEKSMQLLQNTEGLRTDVPIRAEQTKQTKAIIEGPDSNAESEKDEKLKGAIRSATVARATFDARIKQATADRVEMERDKLAGSLIQVEDVDYVLNSFGALLRAHLDGRAERVGAETGLNPEQIAALSDSDRRLMLEVSDALKKQAKIVH